MYASNQSECGVWVMVVSRIGVYLMLGALRRRRRASTAPAASRANEVGSGADSMPEPSMTLEENDVDIQLSKTSCKSALFTTPSPLKSPFAQPASVASQLLRTVWMSG